LALLAAGVLLWRERERRPWLAAAAAFYAVCLLPVLGLNQCGLQLVADRYSYTACLPLAWLAGAALRRALRRPAPRRPAREPAPRGRARGPGSRGPRARDREPARVPQGARQPRGRARPARRPRVRRARARDDRARGARRRGDAREPRAAPPVRSLPRAAAL